MFFGCFDFRATKIPFFILLINDWQGENSSFFKYPKIMKILAREMNKSLLDIVDDSMESKILVGRIKEFNEI